MSGETIRRVFISDIHMGDDRSVNQSGSHYRYCWFCKQDPPIGDRPGMLAAFLNRYCLADESVSEVVILGDLFDAWICPSEFDPTDPTYPMPPSGKQFINIANSIQNAPVIAALRTLASQNRLKYVPGNHDILADKVTMQSIFPGIDYIDTPESHPVYKADGIWAEHGHWYGLFNAPYPVTSGTGFDASILPLGYFISRISAEAAWKEGQQFGLSDIIKDWLEHIYRTVPKITANNPNNHGVIDDILGQLLDTMISEHATGKGAQMNGVCGISGWVDWQAVKNRYASIYSQWSNEHPNNVGHIEAISCDGKDLSPAASLVSLNNSDAKIIIFGHTHICDLSSNLNTDNPGMETLPGGAPVYVNSGAWCYDAKISKSLETVTGCAFVETVFDSATSRHSVQRKEWILQPDGQYSVSNIGYEECVIPSSDSISEVPISVPAG